MSAQTATYCSIQTLVLPVLAGELGRISEQEGE